MRPRGTYFIWFGSGAIQPSKRNQPPASLPRKRVEVGGIEIVTHGASGGADVLELGEPGDLSPCQWTAVQLNPPGFWVSLVPQDITVDDVHIGHDLVGDLEPIV